MKWSSAGPTLALVLAAGAAGAQFADTDWATYHGDPSAAHYSELTQITPENVGRLEVAWTYRSNAGKPVEPRSDIQCNPLVIDGVLYGVTDGVFFAVDAATGSERWRFDPFAGVPGRRWVGRLRGLAHWREGDEQRLLVASAHRLMALDPATGEPIRSFGDDGVVDLREGLGLDPESFWFNVTTPGAVFDDLYIVGGFVSENYGAAPGDIRAYDVRTGQIRWTFHTIPFPDQFGADTWPPKPRETSGAANVWAGFSVDVERGLVFCPTGSASFDFHGGDRLGQNLFANTVIALDAATGERLWHFQTVHHDLWDKDLPAQPSLLTVEHDGRRIDAVAQITKSGYLFLLDRETGEPLFPVVERPVPASTLDGERAWPTQPFPTKPPPFTRTSMGPDDVTNISPEAAAFARRRLEGMVNEGMFTPIGERETLIFPGVEGGAEWGGAAVDPARGKLYLNANEIPYSVTMVKMHAGDDLTPYQEGRNVYARRCSSCHGMDRSGGSHMGQVPDIRDLRLRMGLAQLEAIVRDGQGRMEGSPWLLRRPGRFEALAAFLFDQKGPRDTEGEDFEDFIYAHTGHNEFLDAEGYPAVAPPWGTLTAYDLNEGVIDWQVPLGEYPELTARGIPPTGTKNFGGPVLTASGLLFIAATADETIRAFDQRTGELLWQADLPASGFATPSIYAVDGRQYVVIACGGGKVERPSSDEYVAFVLPE